MQLFGDTAEEALAGLRFVRIYIVTQTRLIKFLTALALEETTHVMKAEFRGRYVGTMSLPCTKRYVVGPKVAL